MNARSLLVCFFAGTVVGLLGVALTRQPAPARQGAAAKAKWEYCSLYQTANVEDGKSTYRVVLPGKTVEAKSAEGLARELGQPKAEDSPNEVLNVLGEQGWELAGQIEYLRAGVVVRAWTFKRPK